LEEIIEEEKAPIWRPRIEPNLGRGPAAIDLGKASRQVVLSLSVLDRAASQGSRGKRKSFPLEAARGGKPHRLTFLHIHLI